MKFPGVLKKYNVEIISYTGVNKKRSGISRELIKKNHVEFPWVLVFGLGNSSGCNTIFWNFQG